MIVECHYCESKVNAEHVGIHEFYDEEIGEAYKIALLKCPACDSPILACQENIGASEKGEMVWSKAQRVWPSPDKSPDFNLPELVRRSISQAQGCFKAKCYDACAVMCGRALEGLCATFKTKHKTLGSAFKELLNRKIIDDKIYAWAEELRKHRNIGAHASEEDVSKEDARDLLDFTNAICNYVFVLTEKFKRFMIRQKEKSKKKK